MKNLVVGCVETVLFPDLGVGPTLAKIDTGAFSGALHCTDIKVVLRGKDKRRILKFTPLGDKKLAQETANFNQKYVRSASGHRSRRFIITTTLLLQGKEYAVNIGLSEREDMRREVLIGRRFLRENNIIVDVRINSELDVEGESVL